jgi:hypothetical protein
MLRILVLAPDSTLDGTHALLIGYSHREALPRLHIVTLITEVIDV